MAKLNRVSKLKLVSPFLKGADGHKGLTGDMGTAGAPGATGQTGTKGDTGATGPQGPIGPQGSKGTNGENGLDGHTGPLGPMPLHEYRGDAIRFEIAPNAWGKWINTTGHSGGASAGSLASAINKTVRVLSQTTGTIGDADILLVDDDAAGGDVTVNLPKASTFLRLIYIKKLGTTGVVNVQPRTGELLDGNVFDCVSNQYDTMLLVAHGGNWYII